MLRPTAIGYDAPSHYGGWGITINFPEDFPRSSCNTTCEDRIPLWCFSGSNYLEKVTSNTTKYQFDTTRMVSKLYSTKSKKDIPANTSLIHTLRSTQPNLFELCKKNCTQLRKLEFRIFAMIPLGFFQEWYPKLNPRKALIGGQAQERWQRQAPDYTTWLNETLQEHPIGTSDVCYIMPNPSSHPFCNKTVKRIRETKDKCLYSDYHPCEYTYVLWQKEFASGLRGRTYFIATWSSLFWLIFVVGVKEWK